MSDCPICKGELWVCENHPDTAWGGGDGCCEGAGMPCEWCNPYDEHTPPRFPPGTVETWHIDKGRVH